MDIKGFANCQENWTSIHLLAAIIETNFSQNSINQFSQIRYQDSLFIPLIPFRLSAICKLVIRGE
jgi:hypothetical protein